MGQPMKQIRSRGQIIPRGERKWLLRVFLGRENGKRNYSSRVFEGTYKQAETELTGMLRETDTQTFVAPTAQTLEQFAREWLTSKTDISERTKVDYEARLVQCVFATLGALRLSDVTPQAVQKLYAGLEARGLSPRTVHYVHAVLRQAFRRALEWHLVARNPCDAVTLPRKSRPKPSVLSPAEVGKLLGSSQDDPLHALWVLLLLTGLRPQEALAVKWSDIEQQWLRVQRALVNDGHGHYSLQDETKTDASSRTIGLPKAVLEALQVHRKRQAAQMLLAGKAYERQGLVFATEKGTILDYSSVARRWKAAQKAAGLTPKRLYSTRHTHATIMLAAGADLKWISSRLGHSSIITTATHYAHVTKEVHQQMAALADRTLEQAKEAASGA